MITEIEKKIKEASIFKIKDLKSLEDFRIKFLGKKGYISHFFSEFKNIKDSEKKAYGLAINDLKKIALQKTEDFKVKLNSLTKLLILLPSRIPFSISSIFLK